MLWCPDVRTPSAVSPCHPSLERLRDGTTVSFASDFESFGTIHNRPSG